MPSGRTHDRITYLAALPVAWGAFAYAQSALHAALAAVGVLFGGLMFGPDLDVKSVQYYRWGPLRWIWWPYQRMFRHRSVWTHGVIASLAVRLVYFALVIAGLGAIAYALINTYVARLDLPAGLPIDLSSLYLRDPASFGMALGGLWLGGALHTWADVSVSFAKRAFKRRRKGR
ncbi:metal-binding protein [bacterium]|nr:metal-binding protein [bacterium]